MKILNHEETEVLINRAKERRLTEDDKELIKKMAEKIMAIQKGAEEDTITSWEDLEKILKD